MATGRKQKFYGVYLAYSKYEVLSPEECDDPNIPEYDPRIAQVRIFKTPGEQLDCFANTVCPASQMFKADNEAEVAEKVRQLKENFVNEEWLKTNIEPFI